MGEPASAARLDRRRFLGGLAGSGAALLAGCTAASSGPAAATTAAAATPIPSTAGPAASPAATPAKVPTVSSPALPATSRWQPSGSEVSPAVKVRAVRLLEALGTWSSGSVLSDPASGPGLAAARARIARLGYDPALADAATVLLGSTGSAAVQVVDAQYGGILSSSSSVLVVLKQWRTRSGANAVTAGGTTVDVRLVAASPHWRVTSVHPAAPAPPLARPGAVVTALLANPKLHLPVAASADLRSGTVSSGVLAALDGLLARAVLDVSVIKSGHPLYVFGTNRLSDHPRGHAVDIWAVDGRPVVDPANRALVESTMRLGIALGAYQVGGPVDLDGGGSLYFSDNTHHDHIHMGFHS